jgi:rare lipoprotein A (RlpA)-like double-psi beta-barrel protein
MQIRRLRFLMYWSAVVALLSMTDSGVPADANIAHTAATGVTSPVAAAAVSAPAATSATKPGPLAEAQPGEPDPNVVQVADQVGLASWYGSEWQGKRTASGEHFDQRKLTAAHRTLPLDTKIKVTNLENGKTIEVKVNDRGPYIPGRVLDLSTQAAKMLGMEKEGLALVRIEIVPQQVAAVDD